MMMVVPVDRDQDKTQHVTAKNWQQGREICQLRSVWRPHFEHHDGDDDGDDAVAECLEPGLSHDSELSVSRRPNSQERSLGNWEFAVVGIGVGNWELIKGLYKRSSRRRWCCQRP